MINPLKKIFLFTLFLTFSYTAHAQSSQVADRIIAVVNDRIILKSDVDDEVRNYMNQIQMQGQPVTFSEDLWYSALQSMVDNYVLLEKAKIDSVVVSDDLVNREMDQRLNQMIRQAGSERALEEAFGQSIIQIRAEYREQFREQMIIQRVQQNKLGSVTITRPEVEEFFRSIPEGELPVIPEQVGVSQIVVIPPALEDAQTQAFEKAAAIRDSIVTMGKDFEEMARRHSDDGSGARGGLIPMTPISDLVANYSAAATALEPGGVSEVVQTQFGFHIIRLNRRSGDNIDTNHILIRIDDNLVDEDYAIEKLNALRDSVLNHDKRFSDLARQYSDDEDTRPFGGRIVNMQTGERLMAINQLDPALYRIVILLDEEGEISEPRSFTPRRTSSSRAFRIVRLDRHIPEHRANLEQDFDRIREIALQRKRMERMRTWMDGLRAEVYIEFKIDMPDTDPLLEDQLPPTDTDVR